MSSDQKLDPNLLSGTAIDPEKVRTLAYGEDNPLANINESIQQKLNELEDRYNKPNWFKIAAGFAKPQLGGFTASLGSAAEAYGNQIEQQKALAIPIFKMRSELGANTAILNREKDVNDEIKAWYADPKNAGKLPPDKLAADWRARASNATGVKSLDTQIALQQKDRDQALQAIDAAIKNGKPVDPNLYVRAGITPANQVPLNDTNQTNNQNTNQSHVSNNMIEDSQANIASLDREIKRLQANHANYPNNGEDALAVLMNERQKEQDKLNSLQGGNVTVGGVNMTPSQVQTFTSESAKAREEPYTASMNDIVAQATNNRGHSYKDQETNLNTMNKLYNGVVYEKDQKGNTILDENGKPKMTVDPNLQLGKAFEKLREPGIGSAALNSILQGVGAHTPWGDIVIKAPVAQFMTSLNLDRKGQERFIEFMRLMAEDRLLQSNLGLLRNEKEFNAAMSSITPEAFDPQQNINSYINKRLAQTQYGQETHAAYHKWRQKNNMDPNVSNFWNSDEHNAIREKYSQRLERATDSLF